MSDASELERDRPRDLRGPTDWRTVADLQYGQLWSELCEWVGWLVARYQLDHRVVPPCWQQHSALVELLTALGDFHAEAFAPTSLPGSAVEWHRAFRDVEDRLREWAGRTGCTSDIHRPDPLYVMPPPSPLAVLVPETAR